MIRLCQKGINKKVVNQWNFDGGISLPHGDAPCGERIHLERHIADGDVLSILTCCLVICGALAFSWFMKRYAIPRVIKLID